MLSIMNEDKLVGSMVFLVCWTTVGGIGGKDNAIEVEIEIVFLVWLTITGDYARGGDDPDHGAVLLMALMMTVNMITVVIVR